MDHYKRNYHPLIILLYAHGMLSHQQIKQIPRSTRCRWNHFSNEHYFGCQWAMDYIYQFDEIKSVFESKFLRRTLKLACTMRNGYLTIAQQFENKNQLLRSQAKDVISAINRLVDYSGENVKMVCRLFGVSRDWYYRHRGDLICGVSKIGRCFKRHPHQLSYPEVQAIERLVLNTRNQYKTLVNLYYQAMHSGVICCAYSTFTKYARLIGYQKPKKIIRQRKQGFHSTRLFEWLHVDITKVPTVVDGMQKVAFVKDNFSGAILHWRSTDEMAGSCFIKTLFEETFKNHNLWNQSQPINILSDGGPENKGDFVQWIGEIQAPPQVRKLTALTDEFPWSNAHSERLHSLFKTEFLQGKIAHNKTEHLKNVAEFVNYNNTLRYPLKFHGLTAIEVLNGKTPDKHLFQQQKADAKAKRVATNREFDGCFVGAGCASLS